MKTFFTADHHFGHANIIKYTNRPFTNIEEQDRILIQNWNSVVGPNDMVYYLGDFCFRDFNKYFHALNGKIIFIEGNHDKVAAKNKEKFVSYQKYLEVNVEGQRIILCHYAFRVWNKSHHGSWDLYGHSHGSLPDDPNARAIDVGIDCHNYFPLEFSQVKRIMDKKNWQPVDGHR